MIDIDYERFTRIANEGDCLATDTLDELLDEPGLGFEGLEVRDNEDREEVE